MSRACGACGRRTAKGKARRAYVFAPDGTVRAANVCKRCAVRAVVVVVPPATTIAPACPCGRGLAEVCRGCYALLGGRVRELIAANITRTAAPDTHKEQQAREFVRGYSDPEAGITAIDDD